MPRRKIPVPDPRVQRIRAVFPFEFRPLTPAMTTFQSFLLPK